MRLGYHLPVSGGLLRAAQRAREIGCECLQIFPRNARGWRSRDYPAAEVEAFRAARVEAGLAPLVLHSNYLVNLASPNRALLQQSRRVVADDFARAALLGARFVVTHPGHGVGDAELATSLERLAKSVTWLLARLPAEVEFLLENTAGGERQLGGEWEHFAHLLAAVDDHPRLGVCFDTCHAHAAGYRLDTPRAVGQALRGFDRVVGLDRLRLIHLNDCKGAAGEHRDRHAHLGAGTIGDVGLRSFLRRRELSGRAAILETPVEEADDDRRNLEHARGLMGG
jgi:deoxyribonuclease IV